MPSTIKFGFLLLVLSQAAHSLEEYLHSLWEVLALARFASRLIASDPAAHKIVESLRRFPNRTRPEPDVLRIKGITKRVDEALRALIEHGGVRRIPAPPGVGGYDWQYRLVQEFAES